VTIVAGKDVALVTGASGGMGRAIVQALVRRGMAVLLTARNAEPLEQAAREVTREGGSVLTHAADLSADDGIRGLAAVVASRLGRLDVLVHAAGVIRLGNVETASESDLDLQYRVNVRAPFLLTKELLSLLRASRGQVLFVNSTAGLAGGPDNVLYAATKHALRALAAGIRDHVNADGIRVISVFPGRTATPMQEAVHRAEARTYDPTSLMQPSDVAEVVSSALFLPRTAEVTDVILRPMNKPSPMESK